MNARRLIQGVLLAVVATGLVLVFLPRHAPTGSQSAPVASAQTVQGPVLTAYYFYGDQRCATCRYIEKQSHDTIEREFAKPLLEGRLRWKAVNIDRPENAHFVDEFGITHSTLLLALRKDGKVVQHTSLERVWELAHQDDAFSQYVTNELNTWLRIQG